MRSSRTLTPRVIPSVIQTATSAAATRARPVTMRIVRRLPAARASEALTDSFASAWTAPRSLPKSCCSRESAGTTSPVYTLREPLRSFAPAAVSASERRTASE